MRYARCDKTHKFNEEYQICKFVETFFVFCAFAYLEFKFTYQDIIRIVKRYKSVQARNNGLSLQKKLHWQFFVSLCRVGGWNIYNITTPYVIVLFSIHLIIDLV